MHNIKTNFDKFFSITKSFLADFAYKETDSLQFYPRIPKIIALALCAETLGIDSENLFWKKLSIEYAADFPHLIDRSNYNKRRRRLCSFIQLLNEKIAHEFNQFETVFIVDSISLTALQYINASNNKPINHLRFALA